MKLRKIISVIIVLGIFATLLSGCDKKEADSTSSQLKKVTISIGNTGAAGIIPVIAAYKNFDEEFGLDFVISPIADAPSAIAAIESGTADLAGWSAAAPLNYIAQGNETLEIIGGLMSDFETFIVKPSNEDAWKGTIDGEFLKGKKIASNRTNSGDIALRGFWASQGIDLSTIEFLELDSPATVIEAVKNGQVDAGIVNGAFYLPAENAGLVNVRFIKELIGDDFICCRQVVQKSDYEKNPEKYKNIEKALIKAYAYYSDTANKEDVLDQAVKFFVTERSQIEYLVYEYGDLVLKPNPELNKIKEYYDGMKASGYIDKNTKVKIEDFVSTKAYFDALDELLKEEPDNEVYKEIKAEFAD
ncbi:MAG: ABC transporter substrate-binding protein [Oscillospiraceae bacterium]|jgi:NitT/TauT family transport system substrate-binding protein|nr:ABC transporter substrate-binding protein [Oscillospiraceae bacterium]